MTLAEVIAESRRLLDPEHYHTSEEMGEFFYAHGPLLARVAEAAMEMREGAVRLLSFHDKCGMVSSHGAACGDGIAAFDAALRRSLAARDGGGE